MTSSGSLNVDPEELPPNSHAIMVHKIIADRVQQFLYAEALQWFDETGCALTDPSGSTTPEYRLLDTPSLRGPHSSRRGFVLLYLPAIRHGIDSLPPTARQNISWAAPVTNKTGSFHPQCLWKSLGWKKEELPMIQLRVDVYPSDHTATVCRGLQSEAARAMGVVEREEDQNDPFAGVISLTRSASKCTDRLTVIWLEDVVMWGVTTAAPPAFNSEAVRQIVWSKTDEKTGEDVYENVSLTTPVSRAYYKLSQMWKQHLSPVWERLPHFPKETTALDVGACPGGWTQVLVHEIGYERVLLIDPGRPAQRVMLLPQMQHIPSRGESVEIPNDTVVSLLVCDVSVIWVECLKENIETIAAKVKNWTLPAAWIITCKLPHKHPGSVQRHVRKMHDTAIPSLLQTCLPLMYPNQHSNIRAKYSISHMMANSDSERTLMVLFEEEVRA